MELDCKYSTINKAICTIKVRHGYMAEILFRISLLVTSGLWYPHVDAYLIITEKGTR